MPVRPCYSYIGRIFCPQALGLGNRAHFAQFLQRGKKQNSYNLIYENNFTLFISHCALALIFSLNLVVVETLLREVM